MFLIYFRIIDVTVEAYGRSRIFDRLLGEYIRKLVFLHKLTSWRH
jgi:hypothetical protein